MSPTMPTFSERLAHRQRVWWEARWPGRGLSVGQAAHRWRERRALHHRDDPEASWRCCGLWPRTLLNKWNGREFAARHGCELPELYWAGADYSRAPVEALPEGFAVRPFRGPATRHGAVVVGERELLRNISVSRTEIQEFLPRSRFLRRPVPVLVEELIRREDGRAALPLELKCHTFAGHVAAVQLIDRRAAYELTTRFYTPGWEPFRDRMYTAFPLDELKDRPGCLERMLELASAMGRSIGTYMRIDFFLTGRGCVFNEFSSVPGGRTQWATPYCDELLGRCWTEMCPEMT